jgi:steroid delta-isomerase-like uncharacterized protein
MATDLGKWTRDLWAALSAHDVEKMLSFHTDDVFVENLADGTVTRGKEELRAYLVRISGAFSDFKVEVTSYFVSGDRQCEEWVMSGIHTGDYMGMPATGKRFSFRGATVRKLREGKSRAVRSPIITTWHPSCGNWVSYPRLLKGRGRPVFWRKS